MKFYNELLKVTGKRNQFVEVLLQHIKLFLDHSSLNIIHLVLFAVMVSM